MATDAKEDLQTMIDRISTEDSVIPDYTFLSDPGHRVIDRYGLFNPDEPRHRPVPHPTVIVIDRTGVVRWKFTEVNYRIRPTNDDILNALAALD